MGGSGMRSTPADFLNRRYVIRLAVTLTLLLPAVSCAGGPRREMSVTATAYNSLSEQTRGDPALAAWGDRLEPGMKAIAVSRDLIPLGLTHRVPVRIEGLSGEYLVLDKLHRRWRERIDIYMGSDREAAIRWGKRTVEISWPVEETDH